MFGLASGLYKTYFSPANLSILIIGLDCSGKTTLLERLKVTQFSTARQLRNLAAQNGGNVPLVKSPSKGAAAEGSRHAGECVGAGDCSDVSTGGKETEEKDQQHASAPQVPPAQPATQGRQENEEQQERGSHAVAAAAPSSLSQGPTDTVTPAPERPRATHRQSSTASCASASTTSSFRRRFLICPAPRMYSRDAMTEADDDEDEVFDEVLLSDDGSNSDEANSNAAEGTGGERQLAAESLSVEDPNVDDDLKSLLDGNDTNDDGNNAEEEGESHRNGPQHDIIDEDAEVEHDLKPKTRMLPLHLVRPTIGQNLAKLDACGCRLSVLDLGGTEKMRPLWDRYYDEVDAVVFVVDARTVTGAGGADGASRLEETVKAFDMVRGQELLDGVPLMVFVNKVDRGESGRSFPEDDGNDDSKMKGIFHPSRVDLDVLANVLNLHGHPTKNLDDGMIQMTAGSARTGEGVRAAFEWLVLKARNVQRDMELRERKIG